MTDTATPADTGLLPRTYFKAPRVPLDLRALFLAVVAWAIFRGGRWVLTEAFNQVDPVAVFFTKVFGTFAAPIADHLPFDIPRGTTGNIWQAIAGGLWVFAVFGFFGQAIHRITALRIARDEGMSLKDSLGFARKNFTTILWCPLIVAAFALVLLGCNALAGLAISIDWVGQLLSIVLVPLAMISSLLALLILIGTFVGMPLVAAAAAWERNGSLDALSRAFSYVFARPLQFYWNYFLIFVFVTVIAWAGYAYERILVNSIDWGLWRETPSMVVNTPEPGSERFNGYKTETKDLYGEIGKETPLRPFARSFESVKATPMAHKLTALVFWVVLNLIEFAIAGAVLWWFLGATTSTYADLRADVDGTEEDEIYLEEEEEDFSALATPGTVPPPPGTVPPPAASAPPSAPPPMPPAT